MKIYKNKYVKKGGTLNNNNILINEKKDFKKYCSSYDYMPSILPKVKHLYAMGDFHGDLKLTINMMHKCNTIDKNYNDLINNNIINEKMIMESTSFSNKDSERLAKKIANAINWIPKDTYVVQVGDQIDRCRPKDNKCIDKDETFEDEASDITILYLMTELNKQAKKKNSAVISLLGNHELMNVLGRMEYVSHRNIQQFSDTHEEDINNALENRKYMFQNGKKYSKFLACTRKAAIIIGSNCFVHAGIITDYIKNMNGMETGRQSLIDTNIMVRRWLLDKISKDNIETIISSDRDDNSLFWTRILGNLPPGLSNKNPNCERYLEPVLDIYNIKNMIIGHTPQHFTHSVLSNSTCKNKKTNSQLIRIDNGSSRAFQNFENDINKISDTRKMQILYIKNDTEIYYL
jgi:hypothetical protein